MSAQSRREKIEAMLELDPGDQFLRYGLANELEAEGQDDEACRQYESLRRDTQPHVPSFLRGAQLLVRLDRIAEARTVLREGIETALKWPSYWPVWARWGNSER
jgi:hypothetical protein